MACGIELPRHEPVQMLQQRDMRLLELNLQGLGLDVFLGPANQVIDAPARFVAVIGKTAILFGKAGERLKSAEFIGRLDVTPSRYYTPASHAEY